MSLSDHHIRAALDVYKNHPEGTHGHTIAALAAEVLELRKTGRNVKLADAIVANNSTTAELLGRVEAAETALVTVTRERDEAREVRTAAVTLMEEAVMQEIAVVKDRNELAAALEHLRETVRHGIAESMNPGGGQWSRLRKELVDLCALPTSEAATTARRGWEAAGEKKMREVANALCDAVEGFTVDEDGNDAGFLDAAGMEGLRNVVAAYYREHYAPPFRLRSLAAQKRQGGGT